MKKFVLSEEYLESHSLGYDAHKRKALAAANDLNTLMKSVVNYAQKILQVRNPNFLSVGKWDVVTNGSHAEIVIFENIGDKDAVRFIIDEVDFIL